MLSKGQLQELRTAELLLLQKHIQLGKEHLSNLLTKQEMDQIFQLATMTPKIRDKLLTDKTELAGTTTLIINAIVTATFGAWMGLSGLLGLQLDSKILFGGVLSFVIALGGYLGFQSDWLAKKKAKDSLEKRKLQDVEASVIQEISLRRNKEIKEKTKSLACVLDLVGIEQTKIRELEHPFNFHKTCLNWLNQVRHLLEKKTPLIEDLIAEIEEIKHSLHKKVVDKKIKDLKTKKLNEAIYKLSNSSKQPYLTLKPWIRANYRDLIVGFIPTLFGSFSSLFVYLGGAPKLAQELGKEDLFHWLMLPEVKLAGIALAILLTGYFAFSFIYLNWKAFKRDRELLEEQASITRKENTMVELDEKLLKVKEALSMMEKVKYLCHFSDKVKI